MCAVFSGLAAELHTRVRHILLFGKRYDCCSSTAAAAVVAVIVVVIVEFTSFDCDVIIRVLEHNNKRTICSVFFFKIGNKPCKKSNNE